jgi:hypothetical protein
LLFAAVAHAATFRFTRTELRFSGRLVYFPVGTRIAECNITLTGSTVGEAIGTLATGTRVGTFTAAALSGCVNGTPRLLIEARAPWSLLYKSIGETGPAELRTLRLSIASFGLLAEGLGEAATGSCLITGTAEVGHPISYVAATLWEYSVGTGESGLLRERRVTILGGRCNEVFVSFEVALFLNANQRILVSGPYLYPASTDFGTVAGESITRRAVTIASSSEATVRSIRVTAGNYFAITDPNRCVGTTLAAGGSCAFNVLFAAPAETGRALSDTVTVETSGGTLEVAVRGRT